MVNPLPKCFLSTHAFRISNYNMFWMDKGSIKALIFCSPLFRFCSQIMHILYILIDSCSSTSVSIRHLVFTWDICAEIHCVHTLLVQSAGMFIDISSILRKRSLCTTPILSMIVQNIQKKMHDLSFYVFNKYRILTHTSTLA